VAAVTDIGTIEILRSQRELWRSGELAADWAERFPELFDEEDVRLVATQGQYGWHFVEWLAAILLYHTTGYLSLVSKYEFAKHRRKTEIVEKVLPADVLAILRDRAEHGHAQGPDLLVYARDYTDWFFCEVKGPGDRLQPEQKRKFEALATVGGKPVRLLHFGWAPR
jgi:VRR-NUC domain-containing protein